MVAVPLPPTVLAGPVANGGAVVFGYPGGRAQADFTGAYASATGMVAINDNDLYGEAGGYVAFAYGASTITVTNQTGLTWPTGARVTAQAAYGVPAPSGGGEVPANVIVLADGETPGDGDLAVFADAPTRIKQGPETVEEVLGTPADVAAGTSPTLATDIVVEQFWRMRHARSAGSPLNIRLPGSSATPSDANCTLNQRVTGLAGACPWQVQEIAAGLEDVEGKITFVNGGSGARNCFPQNHASTGASVRYRDGVVQGDLVCPTGAGSELVVYFTIKATGATGLFQISGFEKFTA